MLIIGKIVKSAGGEGLEMYDLSVCLAAIRRDNWVRLYNSIVESVGDYSFELIFCGPHAELSDGLKNLENVKCIQDYGAPTRAQQISMQEASGRYVTWTADDGWFLPNKLSECIDRLDSIDKEKKALVTQYIEGGKDGLGDPEEGMYCLNSHGPARSPHYPDDFLIFNSVILPTEYFKSIGGFDCRFEVCPMAFLDFGARAQLDGVETHLTPVIFECTHLPATNGDHAPVHFAQTDHDQPLYSKIWNDSSCLERVKIDFNNWKKADKVWKRRFDHKRIAEEAFDSLAAAGERLSVAGSEWCSFASQPPSDIDLQKPWVQAWQASCWRDHCRSKVLHLAEFGLEEYDEEKALDKFIQRVQGASGCDDKKE